MGSSSNELKLNNEQKQAVEHFTGPCLVTAVPGAGKTFALTNRVIKLKEKGVSPRNICCITFTNKAAQEMKDRVCALDSEARRVWVSTFHRLCVRILRRYGKLVSLREGFSIYDDDDASGLMLKSHRMWAAMYDEDPVLDPQTRNALRARINDLRESAKPFDLATEDDRLGLYLQELKSSNAVDFSGILYLAWKVLKENPDISKKISERFKFVLVDEAQDTNNIQYAITKLIATHGNIFMIGDYNQSVYSFRGANPENLNKFIEDFPETVKIILPRNYRSKAEILENARNIISLNSDAKDVNLISERGPGGEVFTRAYETEWQEAECIAQQMKSYQREGYNWEDMAVIYRLNKLSQPFEIGLSQNGIPYQTKGGQSFFSRKEIKTALSYLKLLVNPCDNTAFASAVVNPRRGVGDSLLGQIELFAKEKDISVTEAAKQIKTRTKLARSGLDEFFSLLERKRSELASEKNLMTIADELLKESGYHYQLCKDAEEEKEGPKSLARLENLEKFVEGIGDFEQLNPKADMQKFLQQIALVQDGDNNKNPDSVSLMTMHAAKGLEFPIVFVVGVNNELVPHSRSLQEKKEPEERRLFYVALTRAKDKLHVSYPTMVRKWNKMCEMYPSPYIQDMLGKDSKDNKDNKEDKHDAMV